MVELNILRKKIDEIDQLLIELLSKRLELVAQVGKIKSCFGLPIYDYDRERSMLASRRKEATALGISPDLVEDILSRIMRESYVSENKKGFKTLCPNLRSIVIIGGRGEMGRLFKKMLILSGYQVHILGREDWAYSNVLLSDAGMVIISVPIHLTISIIKKLPPLPEDCILVDLTSIKNAPLQAMLSVHTGPVLGLHPMFGPDIDNMVKQVIVCCTGRMSESYQWFLEQMKIWGVQLHYSNALEHDKNMSFIQALRYFTTFTYAVLLFEEHTDLKELLALSSPAYRLELMLIGRFISNNPRLYADIIFSSERNISLMKLYQQYVNMMVALLEQRNNQEFINQFNKITIWFGDQTKNFIKESQKLFSQISEMYKSRL